MQRSQRIEGRNDLEVLEAYFAAAETVAPGPQDRIHRLK